MFCSKCGAEVAENSNFCSNCGAALPKSNDMGSSIGSDKMNNEKDSQRDTENAATGNVADAVSASSTNITNSKTVNESGLNLRAAMFTLAAISGVCALVMYSTYSSEPNGDYAYWFEYDGGSFVMFILLAICIITGVIGVFSKK